MSKPMRLLRQLFAPLLLAAALAACGGAYADAIAKGDKYAEAAQWAEAAAAYQQAIKIDPNDPEAKIKLKEVRRKQAAALLNRALAMEKRGEVVAALALIQEAADFDPDNVDAQRALTRVTNAVLDKADKLFKDGQLRKAFELTTLVLKGAKNHPRGRDLDDRVRSALAEKSFKRGKGFVEKNKLGNALVEFAACLTYRPDYPDAKLHFGQVKLRLEEELRFTVVLDKFGSSGKATSIASSLNPELVQQSIDDRLLLEVVKTAPKDTERKGVVVRGQFAGYGYVHGKSTIQRSCDYVCGTTYKPNPRIQQLRSELARLDQDVARNEQTISRNEKSMMGAEKDLSRKESDAMKRQGDVDTARSRLDKCRASAPPDKSSACSSDESNLRSKQSSLDSARRNVESARSKVNRMRDDVARAKSSRDSARSTRESKNQDLLKTPEKIAIDKFCPHKYAVDQHAVDAKVTLELSVIELVSDNAIIRDQPYSYAAKAADETFSAQAGRCAEIASGDPLQLPSEKALQKQITTKVVKDLRSKILASYDAYRRTFLTAAQRDESSGLTEEATESYVRYVLTGPHALDDKKKLGDFFNKTKGIGKLDALWKN